MEPGKYACYKMMTYHLVRQFARATKVTAAPLGSLSCAQCSLGRYHEYS